MYIIGIDPGPITGIVRIALEVNRPGSPAADGAWLRNVEALQVSAGALVDVLEGLHAWTAFDVMALERFVVGNRSARSSTPGAGEATRNAVALVTDWARQHRIDRYERSAANVKPWATDERLTAAGITDQVKGMRHARDAGRHALYCAVRDFGLPDPLSRKAGAR